MAKKADPSGVPTKEVRQAIAGSSFLVILKVKYEDWQKGQANRRRQAKATKIRTAKLLGISPKPVDPKKDRVSLGGLHRVGGSRFDLDGGVVLYQAAGCGGSPFSGGSTAADRHDDPGSVHRRFALDASHSSGFLPAASGNSAVGQSGSRDVGADRGDRDLSFAVYQR